MPEAKLSFACPTPGCDGVLEEWIDAGEPDYSAEVHSDGDYKSDEYLTCPECEAEFMVSIVNSMGHVTASVEDHDDVDVDIKIKRTPYSDVEYEDYLAYLSEYDPPSNAQDLYERAVAELKMLLHRNPDESDDGILYRMIFSQFIAIFEAYLADRLVRLVIDEKTIRDRLLDNAGAFKEMKLALSEAINDPEAGMKAMKGRLQSQLYHKLDEVKRLYQIALKVDIFPDDAVKDKIATAVMQRHDCVHRNGRDKDDNVNRFPVSYILDVFMALDSVVQNAEKGARKAVDDLPF
ncbi:hypothetical protein [Devosia sp. CAU 1758]